MIGSFRQHYEEAVNAAATFREAGWHVTSPSGAAIRVPGIDFVRLESDPETRGDPTVQTMALHRILRAELVYTVAPGGYVGRTTSYEIGRVMQARRPLYFSEAPTDLPLQIPDSHIWTPRDLIALLEVHAARELFIEESGEYAELERRLLSGDYLAE